MAASVVVLTPNGRRQTVKVTPNTTILQILEEACNKHGFKPEEYDIKHHRTVLDTTSTIRFSGLPNNALLELIQASVARTETEVILGVQLEDGRRLLGNFTPKNNLWDILSNLCPVELNEGHNVVIIYMRQEIYGTALYTTDLKSLGITGGRAMLRLIHKSPEELKKQANISAPLPLKPVEEKPYLRQLKRIETEPVSTPHIAPVQLAPRYQPSPSQSIEQPIRRPQPQMKDDKNNILGVIKQEKRKQTDGIKTKNISPPIKREEIAEVDDFVFLGERNAMLFSLETAQTVRSDDLPDDFYELSISDIKRLFRDIKKQRMEMENSPLLTSALRDLEESKKQLRNLNQYKKAVIRVQFPTRLVLQGIFTPTETIDHVMMFVKEYLNDQNIKFYLFTAPPKTVLQTDSSLIEVDCVPGALLYFGCDAKMDNYLREDILNKLTTTTMASRAATKFRDENKRNMVNEPEEDLNDILTNDVNVGASTSAQQSPSYDDYYKKPVEASPPEKVPKWFKPTK